jgi:peptide/nickel transport system substrate-binding protein
LLVFAVSACVQRVENVDPPAQDVQPPAGDARTPAPVDPPPAADPANDDDDEPEAPAPASAVQQADALASLNAVLENFPQVRDTGAAHVTGTTFFQGIITDSPLPGNFGGAVFYDAAVDAVVTDRLGTSTSVLSMTPLYTFGQDGVATWEYSLENNSFTLTMQRDVYWHDGVPLTMADLAYAYYVMAHPDYTGIRFSTNERRVVGIMDYRNGLADHIEGLVLSNNDRTLTIYFEELSPDMVYFGFWTAPLPKHIFENIPVADMPGSTAVLGPDIVGWGPFMLENIVPGESVYMVRNDNYVWGTPYIERLVVERIEASLVPAAMETGRFDVISFPTLYYEDNMNPVNFSYMASPNANYSYVAFRLGHWDFDENRNVFTPEREMNNVYLRRAMAHAINQDEIGELLFSGLQFAAGSFMPPHHPALMDLSLPGFPYDPEYARQILADGGFVDVDGDGYVEWPDGRPLTVVWGRIVDASTDHIIVPLYQQSWAAIGIRVELWQGRTHDQNFMWDTLDYDTDNDEIHIYTAAWQSGANPNPSGRWGPYAQWNPSRYTSPEWEQILRNLSDIRAFDSDFMREAYFAMQAYLQANVPYFPTLWGISLTAVNNRVVNWDTRVGVPPAEWGIHTVRLGAAQPSGR